MKKTSLSKRQRGFFGADDEARTRYLHLGKVALYQMSYIRTTLVIIHNTMAFVNSLFEIFYFICLAEFILYLLIYGLKYIIIWNKNFNSSEELI